MKYKLLITPLKTKQWMIVLFLMNSVLAFGQTTYYSKASATDFNDVNTWGTANDGTGTSPSSISNADIFVIRNGAALSLSANASVRQLTISSGNLTISANTLTVAITAQNNTSITVSSGGTLNVSGGTLNVDGQFSITGTGILNQSGGSIVVDGNAGGVAASSVTGSIVNLASNALTFSGGVFQVVDPHQGTGNAFTYNTSSGIINASATHTFWFGSTTSTDAGGGTGGFIADTWYSSGRFHFGTLKHGGSTGTNRFMTFVYSTGVLGELIVETGGDVRTPSNFYVKRNITVNAGGTLSATGTLYLADYTSSSQVASNIAQTISGAGTFRNSTTTATASISSLTVNNSSAAGVTLSIPLSVSGTLTLTTGIVHTTAANTLRLGTATGAGTLSGGSTTANIDGPFLRTFAASRTASGTYTASTLFPVSKGGSYLPAWIDPTTNSGGPVILSGEAFTSNSGTPGSGIVSVSSNRWEGQVVSGAANLNGAFLQLADGASLNAAKTILQATTAAGSYEAVPVPTTFTSGTLNTVRTNAIIPVASLTGFICYGEPLPCTTPGTPPTNFTSNYLTNNSFSGSFTASSSAPTGYLVVRYASGATPTNPVNGTSYAAAAALGTGTVVGSITGTTFNQTGLTAGTTYDYYIYSYNGGSGCAGPVYNTTTPLLANVTTCAAAITTPTAASAVLVTTASFTARWNPSAGVTYLFDLSTSSTFTSFVTGYQELPLFDTFINLSGLNPASVYYYRVRATNAGCYSNLSSVITVKTLCNPVTTLPYVEDFSSVAAGTIPVCMATENLNNDGGIWNTVAAPTTPAGFTNNVMRYNYNTSNAANDWFFTAALSLTAGTSYRLKFNYANGDASYPEKLRVMYGNAQTNTAMTVQIYDNPNISDVTLHTASVDFTPATSGDYYIGFKAYSITDQYYLFVDSITLDLSPSCLNPTIAKTIVTGPNTATVRWNAPATAPAAGYDIFWSTTYTPPTGVTSPNGYSAVDTFYAISGLSAATKHYAWVRSNCGGNGTSAWTNVDSFTTACNPVNTLPYTENFNAVSAGTLPACTYTENLNNDNGIWNTVAAPTIPAGFTGNVLRYNYNSSNAANDWFFTAPLSLTAGTSYRLTFDYGNNDADYVEKLRVMYGSLQTNTGMTVQIYDNPNIDDETKHTASVDFVPATTGTYYIGFKAYSISDQYNLYVDNINLDLSPACADPIIASTIVTGPASATARWKAPASAPAAGYDIFWSTTYTPPTGVTSPNGYSAVDTFYAISGLSASTKHYVWVRSNCGGSGTSPWSNVDSFTTACNPVTTLPYTENFNAVSAGTLPVCTYTENLNNDNGIWNTVAAPTTPAGFTGNVLRYNYNSSNAANDWFFTAPLTLTAGTSYRLTFDYGNNDADYVEKLRVMYGSLQTNTGMTVQIYDNPNIDDETKHTASVDFVPATTGTYYIGFKAYSISDQYNLYVDNINLDLSPACTDPTIASTIVTGQSTATARWKAPASAPAAGYDIYWSTSSTAPTGATSPNGYSAVDTFYAISGLSAGTTHYVWVRSNCGGSGTSIWSSADVFTTNLIVNSLPYSQDFEGTATGWSSAAVSGNLNEWTLGTPAKINIIGSHSGTNAWVTNLTNDYSNNQNAALISPVFDLSSYATTPILRFYHQFEAEEDYDAGIVEISINNGVWVRLDSVAGTGSNWNTPNSYAWYNNSSTYGNISPRKFSGESATYPSAINGWIQSATYLTGAAGQSNVRIRFRFNSDGSSVGDGWAIDDIEILESPLAPSIPAFNISGTPANTTAALNWTNGNGSGRIVVARLATDVAVAPADFKLYAANAAFHGNGADSTGLGNYVVYNGTGTSVNVTGLTALTSYVFDVYEYNGKYMHVKFGSAGSGNITTTPVKLLSFDGVNVNGNVDLTWITASERNNAGFEIERSTDGKTFVKTGFEKGAGNSSVRLRYAFTDDRAFAKTATDKIYYRLKQLDNDKKFEYSNVIAVTENSKNVFSVTAFPVPFNSELKIGVASLLTANANIFICDLQGKVVFEQDIALNEGSNTITLNQLNNLDAGVYFVKVVQNNQTKVIRVMKAE
jgi:hypothetical protein